MPHTVTANGDAQIDTAQSKFGGASGLFDGTGDYLSIPDHSDWQLGGGTGDFTIDMWVRPTDITNVTSQSLFAQRNGAEEAVIFLNYTAPDIFFKVSFIDGVGGSVILSAAESISNNTWYHLAVVKNGTTYTSYLDGVQSATITKSFTYPNINSQLTIGSNSAGSNNFFYGWIEEYRVSNVARWTTNFTPPTSAYTTDANTKLLLHMDGADGSTSFVDSGSGGAASSTFKPKVVII